MKHASFGLVPTTGQTNLSTSIDAKRLKSGNFKFENEPEKTTGSVNEIIGQSDESARNLALFLKQRSQIN